MSACRPPVWLVRALFRVRNRPHVLRDLRRPLTAITRCLSCHTAPPSTFRAIPGVTNRPTDGTRSALVITPSVSIHSGRDLVETEAEDRDIAIPDPPTNCCMSGCANCVWIDYAQELSRLYRDSGRAADKVIKAIEDPSLRIFLNIELKNLDQEKEEKGH